MKKLLIPSFLLAVAPCADAATYVYDVTSRLSTNALLSTDGWNDSTDLWIAGTFNIPSSARYARQGNSNTETDTAPDTIFRTNDGGFSFVIPNGTPRITLTVTGRGTTANWEAGLATGTTRSIGLGADLGNDNKYYIYDNGTIVSETGTTVPTTDTYSTVKFDFNLLAGTADLIFDPAGANTLLLDDVDLSISAASVEGTNSLYISSGTRFAGASTITIETIPEPSAALLGALGMMVLFARARRR